MTAAMAVVEAGEFGTRAKLGAVVPSINSCAEPELRAMSPAGVELYATRVRLGGTTSAELRAAGDAADEATRLLGDLNPDVTVFHCTAATVFGGRAEAAQLEQRLTRLSEGPVFLTSTAVVAALHALDARSVALVTPYDSVLTQAEAAFLREHGFALPVAAALDVRPLSDYPLTTSAEWHDIVVREIDRSVNAVFVSCTNIRTAAAIAPLERTLGVPVITSNQAAVWHALRTAGLSDPVEGYGQLLSAPMP